MNLIPVVFFTLLMGFSSFFIGMTPTWIHTTKDNLDLVSAFGAGLLVGALFLVVIPEGIETIYKQQQQLNTTTSSTIDWESDHDEKEERMDHLEKLIGQSLLLGFAFMFVIDKISSSKDTQMSVPISLSELRNSDYSNGHRHSPSLGLIVHAFADGVALGATFVTDNQELEWVLLIALILHKTPTAFGFGAMLVHQKMHKTKLKRYLLFFSGATPLGALLTYFVLGSQQFYINIGALLLFSGGTFLYASMHCLEQVFTKVRLRKIMLVLIGMIVPMFITIKHSN